LLVKVSRKLADFYQSGLAEQKVTSGESLSLFLFVLLSFCCVCFSSV
jgi:hypothetical protein